ncbi:accelerated cell death 11-like [Abrus precatorius]|uniref:Accelerated cell death 11-like n=1 Tax=Abrus precatorius TaxID=3816 RepID=A0A8B8K4Z5_ABRPR|nr:accelerated cell death 11-like [Abrus precatorius]
MVEAEKKKSALLMCFGVHACRKKKLQSVPRDMEERRRSNGSKVSAAVDEKPLRKIADAFKDLANVVTSQGSEVDIAALSRACAFVAPLFGCVGFHFKFIEMDYVSKVKDIAEASKSFRTLQSMVDQDIQTNSVRIQGSHSRNLLKIKRGLDFLRVLFEQILLTEGNSIRDAVTKAYTQIFNSYHGWALRKAVAARIHYIPTKQQIFRKISEDESSGRVLMQAYILASPPLLQYIEKIFLERELGIDW